MDNAAKVNALVGSVIDERYEVGAPIGAGAMGQVYRARQRALDRAVALKVIGERHAGDAELVSRFKREAQAASAIGHPGIVQVIDFGSLPDGRAYMVMELVEGRSLSRILSDEGPLDVERALTIGARLCHILAAAHDRGIVHRDLKPDNLLVAEGDRLKLIDFGIAKLLDVSLVLTKANTMVGTPLYMAPEQWQGEEVDGRTDLYAVGAILFEMIAGRPPFETDQLHTIIAKHLGEVPPALAQLVPSVSRELSDLVASCLAKTREGRPASAQALAGALERMGPRPGHVPTRLGPNVGVGPVSPMAATTKVEAKTEIYSGRRVAPPAIVKKRSWVPLVVAVGGLLALLLSAGAVYTGLVILAPPQVASAPAGAPPSVGVQSIAPVAVEPSSESPDAASAPDDLPAGEGTAQDSPPEPATPRPRRSPTPSPTPPAPREPVVSPERATEAEDRPANAQRQHRFLVESVPSGAWVVDNLVRVGSTPHELDPNPPRSITIAKPGYEPRIIRVSPERAGEVVRLTPEQSTPPTPDTAMHSSRTRDWEE